MVQAGIFHLTVVEQPIAERWGKILPKLRVDRQLVISEPGEEFWFVRRDASMLRASVDRFLSGLQETGRPGCGLSAHLRRLYQVHYPLARPTVSVWKNCARPCKNMLRHKIWTG